MKKALDYVCDYQLKSACADAICIAPSKVTQMIFAVLEDWYHHIVLTHSCKLVSFFAYIFIWFMFSTGRSVHYWSVHRYWPRHEWLLLLHGCHRYCDSILQLCRWTSAEKVTQLDGPWSGDCTCCFYLLNICLQNIRWPESQCSAVSIRLSRFVGREKFISIRFCFVLCL